MNAPQIQIQDVIDNLSREVSRLVQENAVLRATVSAYQAEGGPPLSVVSDDKDKTG